MSQSLADYHGIQDDVFAATGALDPILDVDTRLFIDPSLLRVCSVPELTASYASVVEYFDNVMKIVRNIQEPRDRMWRKADELLKFPEVAGLSIGYASKGTSGSGMGPALREHLLGTIIEIVNAGVSDPTLFELVGIFEDGIGPDRISDMVARIIASDLVKFTQRVCRDCGIPMTLHRLPKLNISEDLPSNPLTGNPIILVPNAILRDLPIAHEYADIEWIASHNATLREELNSLIGANWRRITIADQKLKLRNDFVRFPEVLKDVIRAYLTEVPDAYDFEDDRSGEVIWYKASKRMPSVAPLDLTLSDEPTVDEVFGVVTKICTHFRSLVEDNQLGQLLYDKGGKPKHESAAQLLFYGVASAYCKANNLDLSPESDAGRGPVDFKVSRGFVGKVLVELKLTSNSRLRHGFDSQLPIYQRAENATRGIYLVIDNGGASASRLAAFRDIVSSAGERAPQVIWVDAVRRKSASKSEDQAKLWADSDENN